jgi:hypothetical protein
MRKNAKTVETEFVQGIVAEYVGGQSAFYGPNGENKGTTSALRWFFLIKENLVMCAYLLEENDIFFGKI